MKDTIIFVNFPSTNGALELGTNLPERSVLKSLKGDGYNVFCKFYRKRQDDQNAPSIQTGPPLFAIEESMDSIVAYYADGLLTWVEGDTVLISGNPSQELINKGKSIQKPLTIMQKSAYEAGKPGSKGLSLKTQKDIKKEHQKK